MRTIDRASESLPASPMPSARRQGFAGFRWIVSFTRRIRGAGRRLNHASDLNTHALRDIGLDALDCPSGSGLGRAARQDARLSEARRTALMFTMGIGGR